MNMIPVGIRIEETLSRIGVKTRPNSSSAWKLSFLLPIAVIIPAIKSPEIVSPNYKPAIISAFGIIISQSLIILQCIKYKNIKIGTLQYAASIFTSMLYYTCLRKGILFSIYSGIFSTILYSKCLPHLLKTFPRSFSFAEGSLATQGLILFAYEASFNIFNAITRTPTKVNQISTLILQVGIIGLGIISYITYKKRFFRTTIPFYGLTLFVFSCFIILPLFILLKQNPIQFILDLLRKSDRTIFVILFWALCTSLAAFVIYNQIRKGRKANTVTRKTFHILAFVVFLTGLIDQCSILYLASGIILVLFFALEILRNLNLPPLGSSLQDGFVVLCDEKDAGPIALTPIYLLTGCALPMWIHPDSCDVTDSAGFNLLPLCAGILSTGIGDTFASAIGTWIGRHRWPKSKKTVEGTVACILSQLIFIYLLINSGYIIDSRINIIKTLVAVILTSIAEATTDQIDNIILPLISYIILY